MSAEETFAKIGKTFDTLWANLTAAVADALPALQRAQEQIWRARHHGEAADAVGEYSAYRSAVITITAAATTDTRIEMDYALARARREARAAADVALMRLALRLLDSTGTAPVYTDEQWQVLTQALAAPTLTRAQSEGGS